MGADDVRLAFEKMDEQKELLKGFMDRGDEVPVSLVNQIQMPVEPVLLQKMKPGQKKEFYEKIRVLQHTLGSHLYNTIADVSVGESVSLEVSHDDIQKLSSHMINRLDYTFDKTSPKSSEASSLKSILKRNQGEN